MATQSQAGHIAAVGFAALAVVTSIAVGMAAYHARNKRIEQHRQWAYRSVILLCSPALLRLGTYVTGWESMNTYRFLSWASWLMPMVVYECYRRIEICREKMNVRKKNLVADFRWPGFTLLELIIVIVIIGILVEMLLPMTRSVREAAKRTACMNNLRQIGLAILNFESAHAELPMAVGHCSGRRLRRCGQPIGQSTRKPSEQFEP